MLFLGLSDVKVYEPYDPNVDEPYVYEPYIIDTVSMPIPEVASSVQGYLAHKKTAYPRREREFFIDNLLVRIHLIIEMIIVDRPCAMGV